MHKTHSNRKQLGGGFSDGELCLAGARRPGAFLLSRMWPGQLISQKGEATCVRQPVSTGEGCFQHLDCNGRLATVKESAKVTVP